MLKIPPPPLTFREVSATDSNLIRSTVNSEWNSLEMILYHIMYTAKNGTDLLQLVNFTGLLQVVNRLQHV